MIDKKKVVKICPTCRWSTNPEENVWYEYEKICPIDESKLEEIEQL